MKVIKPFGPTIGKTKLTKSVVNRLNKFSDVVVKNKSLSKKYDYDHRLIGSMKQQFRIPAKILKSGLESAIKRSIKEIIKPNFDLAMQCYSSKFD